MLIKTDANIRKFDDNIVKVGYLLYAKHTYWDAGRAGVITFVSDVQIIVQFPNTIGSAINHFIINLSDVLADAWTIRISADLLDVDEYIGGQSE